MLRWPASAEAALRPAAPQRRSRGHAFGQRHRPMPQPLAPVIDLPARHPVLARHLRHPDTGHQALRHNPRLLRVCAPPACRTFDHFKPTAIASTWDVQLDVHFAVSCHAQDLVHIGGIFASSGQAEQVGKSRGPNERLLPFGGRERFATRTGHAMRSGFRQRLSRVVCVKLSKMGRLRRWCVRRAASVFSGAADMAAARQAGQRRSGHQNATAIR